MTPKIVTFFFNYSPLQLFKSFCLPFILYETEAIPLSKSSVKLLDECVKQAVAKVFSVHDNANVDVIRQYCDLPYIGDMIENRPLRFVDKILDTPYLRCLFQCSL